MSDFQRIINELTALFMQSEHNELIANQRAVEFVQNFCAANGCNFDSTRH